MSQQQNENEPDNPDTPDPDLPDNTKAGPQPESTEIQNIVSHFFEGLDAGDLNVVDEMVAPDYTADFISSSQVVPGRDSLKDRITMFRSAFPDINTTVEDMIVAEDKVVARYTVSGTHRGEFMGIRPTNRLVQFKGVDIFRIADGKIAEQWTSRDDLSLKRTLE